MLLASTRGLGESEDLPACVRVRRLKLAAKLDWRHTVTGEGREESSEAAIFHPIRSQSAGCRHQHAVVRHQPPALAVVRQPRQPLAHAVVRQPRQLPARPVGRQPRQLPVGRQPMREAGHQHAARVALLNAAAPWQLLGPSQRWWLGRSGVCARRMTSRSGRATHSICSASSP